MSIDRLYKFGRLNQYSEQLFSTGSIWFPSAIDLNDPYECTPTFAVTHNPEKIMASLVRGIQIEYPKIKLNDAIAEAVKIYQLDRHRDQSTWDEIKNSIIFKLRNEVGIYSLCENRKNILMWSHYADQHRGYCISFEATDFTPMFGMADKVSYFDTYPIIDYFNTSSEERAKIAFKTKFTDWKYEEEWRIIDVNGSGSRSYPVELMESVTFGLGMKAKERELIRTWIMQRGKPVRFYECVQAKERFELEFKEIA
jgi:Protein of unknown function (DUF2971)